MKSGYGLVIGCILLGFVSGVHAEQKYAGLIGDWIGTGVLNCSPCQISIQGIQDDGKLILQSSIAGDPVESWGEAKHDGEKIGIHIEMAGGSIFDLTLSKSGEFLQGLAQSYARQGAGGGIGANFRRVPSKK